MTIHNALRTATVLLSGAAPSSAYADLTKGAQAPMARVVGNSQPPLFPEQLMPSKSSSEAFRAKWLSDVVAVLVRTFDYGESPEICARDLDLWAALQLGSVASPAKIAAAAKSMASTRVALKFRATNSGVMIPWVPTVHAVQQQANEIATRLFKLAGKKPDLVRDGVMHFVDNADSENLLIVSASDNLSKIKTWISLVNHLKLTIRVIGFEFKGKRDLKSVRTLLRSLGLSKLEKDMIWHQGRNSGYLSKVGLSVVSTLPRHGGTTITRSSEAYRFVMASAAIANIWELAQDSKAPDPPEAPEPESDVKLQLPFAF